MTHISPYSTLLKTSFKTNLSLEWFLLFGYLRVRSCEIRKAFLFEWELMMPTL